MWTHRLKLAKLLGHLLEGDSTMVLVRLLAFNLFALAIGFSTARAEIIYEGWHKVLSAGQHVGYYIQRYEIDPKTKVFTSIYFLKTNSVGNDVMEAVKAQSKQVTEPIQWLVPISYSYTSTIGKKTKIIDAIFKEEKDMARPEKKKPKKGKAVAKIAGSKYKSTLRLVATINENGQTKKIDSIIPENSFISTFLTYIMLQSKAGLKVGNNFSYSAVAEEDAAVYDGTALVKESTKYNDKDSFKVINEFKKDRFISYINEKGEVLGTKSPLLSLATEAVGTAEEAYKGFTLDEKHIKQIFGNIPGVRKSKD